LGICITFSVRICCFAIFTEKPFLKKLHRFFTKKFSYFFYLSAIIFGLAHLYALNIEHFYEYFLFPIDYIIAGVLLGYIRVKYGFWWGLFIHSFHNFSLLTISLISNYFDKM
jgi:hypothetical protein